METTRRAKLFFSLFLAFLFLFYSATVVIGVKSGELERRTMEYLKNYAAQKEAEEKARAPILTPTPFPTLTIIITPTKAPVVNKPIQQPAACYQKNIREGEFASNKCYSRADFEDLEYYLQRFNSSVFSLSGAQASMKITCNGSDFFKQSCEEDKAEAATAQSNIDKYRGIIQGIIAKGR